MSSGEWVVCPRVVEALGVPGSLYMTAVTPVGDEVILVWIVMAGSAVVEWQASESGVQAFAMALLAGDLLVSADQRVGGLVVVEDGEGESGALYRVASVAVSRGELVFVGIGMASVAAGSWEVDIDCIGPIAVAVFAGEPGVLAAEWVVGGCVVEVVELEGVDVHGVALRARARHELAVVRIVVAVFTFLMSDRDKAPVFVAIHARDVDVLTLEEVVGVGVSGVIEDRVEEG